jgi:4a-hydroxytetrahydrobiopterin dehydratase
MSWKEESNKLTQEFVFKNQTELAQFLIKVAELADKANHHPDAQISKASHLRLELFTHTENKVTEKDRKLANEISEL